MTKAFKILGSYISANGHQMDSIRRKHDGVTHYEIIIDGQLQNSTTDRHDHSGRLNSFKAKGNYTKHNKSIHG